MIFCRKFLPKYCICKTEADERDNRGKCSMFRENLNCFRDRRNFAFSFPPYTSAKFSLASCGMVLLLL
jgi:hypothetical protein